MKPNKAAIQRRLKKKHGKDASKGKNKRDSLKSAKKAWPGLQH